MGHATEERVIRNHAVVALQRVVRGNTKGGSGKGCKFNLEEEEKWRISGSTSRTSSKQAVMKNIQFSRFANHLTRPNAADSSEVSLIDMDDSEAVYF